LLQGQFLGSASPKAAMVLRNGWDGIWDGERDSDEYRVECGCSESKLADSNVDFLCREAPGYYCSIRSTYLGCRRMSALGLQFKWGRRLRRVRVCVYGQDAFREYFRKFPRMLSVNAHGGLIALAAPVEKGQIR
jgi:hypothetical protein